METLAKHVALLVRKYFGIWDLSDPMVPPFLAPRYRVQTLGLPQVDRQNFIFEIVELIPKLQISLILKLDL